MFEVCILLFVYIAPSACFHNETCHGDSLLSTLLNDDSHVESASLNLIQYGAQLKLQRQAVRVQKHYNHSEVPAPNAKEELMFCGTSLLTPVVRFHLEAAFRLGIIHYNLSQCRLSNTSAQQQLSFSMLKATSHTASPIMHRGVSLSSGIVSGSMLILWALCSLCLICTCLLGVASTPFQNEPLLQKSSPCIVDEVAAWNTGFLHWFSLSWIDGLIGRYGKYTPACIESSEFCPHLDQKSMVDFYMVRDAWNAEIKERGLLDASILNLIRRIVGLRTCCAFILCAWTSALLELLGMVCALDVLLSFTSEVVKAHERTSPPVVDPLNSILLVLGLLFVLPLSHRFLNTILNMIDGHFASLLSYGLNCLIYEKSLRLPVGSAYHESGQSVVDSETAHGKPTIVQLLNMDIANEASGMFKALALLSATPPIMIGLFAYLLYELQFAGLLGAVFAVPNLYFAAAGARLSFSAKKRFHNCRDLRVGHLAELFSNMRSIKALAWERPFCKKVRDARKQELDAHQTYSLSSSFSIANSHALIWLMSIGGLFVHILLYGSTEAQNMWVVLQIVASLQACAGFVAAGTGKLASLPITFHRVASFLKQSEQPADVLRTPDARVDAPSVQLCGSFTFEEGGSAVLNNLNISFSCGELVAIIGKSGSGKSAFLQAILGELFPVGLAHVVAPKDVFYTPQIPSMLNGTVQENVIWERKFERERYRAALDVSGLAPLLKLSSSGDEFLGGPTCCHYSASECARIVLARAAYADGRSVYLIDNIFGLMPEQLQQHVFKHVLASPALRGSTRFVVLPSDSKLLKMVDRVVVLQDGHVVLDGSPEVALSDAAVQKFHPRPEDREDECVFREFACSPISALELSIAPETTDVRVQALPDGESDAQAKLRTLDSWVFQGGTWQFACVIALTILQRMVQFCEFLGLAYWANSAELPRHCDNQFHITMILGLVFCNASVFLLSDWLSSRFGRHAGANFHELAMGRALACPKNEYFNKLPVRRLLTRLSVDMIQVDCVASHVFFSLFRIVVGLFIQQVYILSIVPPWVVFCACPLYCAAASFGYMYRGTATSLMHCARLHQSRVQDIGGCTVDTHLSIRANGLQQLFMVKYSKHAFIASQASYLLSTVCKAWVSLRVTFCSSVLVSTVALYALMNPASIGVGTLGLVISLFFAFIADLESVSDLLSRSIVAFSGVQRIDGCFNTMQDEVIAESKPDTWYRFQVNVDARICKLKEHELFEAMSDTQTLRLVGAHALTGLLPESTVTALQNDVYHVVAVNDARRNLEQMREQIDCSKQSLQFDLWHWSYIHGLEVQLSDVCAGYGTGPDILRGLGAKVPPLTKAAFVGPANSGKSTVLNCLLRHVELRSGHVCLGHRELSRFDLHELPSVVGMVPQSPAIFRGTWRENLDPFDYHAEHRLWNALCAVKLDTHVRSLEDGIDSCISPSGSHLNSAQKWLLGIARMILQQPPILLLDDCPIPMDSSTLEAAEAAISFEFPMSTIIAVTGSMRFLHAFDMVLVLRDGAVVEWGRVSEEQHESTGLFSRAGAFMRQ